MAAAVGIDIGTSNTKVVRVERGVGTTMLNLPTPTGLDELLAIVAAGLRDATSAGRVDAVGIASMAESGYPLDAEFQALTPLLSWRDGRDDSDIRALANRVGADALFEATGVRPGPKPTLAVLLWLRSQQPGTFAAMRHWAGVADAVHQALTGELRTDHTLAGRSLAYRLPATNQPLATTFDADLLAEAGLAPARLPRVGLPGEAPARSNRATSAATGLRTGTPVVVAGHDHQVAAWASGVREIGQLADSVGTAEAMLNLVGHVPDRPAVRAQGMSVVRTVDGNTEALLAGTGTAGGFLQWLADRYTGGDVDRLLAGTEPADLVPPDYPVATGAEDTSLFAHCGVIDPDVDGGNALLAGDAWLLPYPAGRQCPEPDPTARVAAVGGEPRHLGLEALEAVSYQAQWAIDVQSRLAGRPITRLSLSGHPLHRSPLWPRIRATLARVPTTLTTATEPVAIGAALLALDRTGLGDGTPLPSRPIDPLRGAAARYRLRLNAFIASARAACSSG